MELVEPRPHLLALNYAMGRRMPLVEAPAHHERRAAALRAEVEADGVGAVETPKRRPPNRKGAAAVAAHPKVHVRCFVR